MSHEQVEEDFANIFLRPSGQKDTITTRSNLKLVLELLFVDDLWI